MNKINREQWYKIRKQGVALYLLIHWVLLAALPAGFIMTIFRWIIQDRSIKFYISGDFAEKFLFSFILCAILAFVSGLLRWNSYEKLYRH